ncbi:hypothetical protein, partial [Deinococcus sp. 12RED42]|uniref:hypothetical protein n=1 Tax=Deinococcus sp. 12RED42 TaxID=2745872 RepID=UPI001E42A494
LGTTHAAPAPLVGVASVINGDTLEIRGVRVRLYGSPHRPARRPGRCTAVGSGRRWPRAGW